MFKKEQSDVFKSSETQKHIQILIIFGFWTFTNEENLLLEIEIETQFIIIFLIYKKSNMFAQK